MHPLESRLFLNAGDLDTSFARRSMALLEGADGNTANICALKQPDGKFLSLAGPRPKFQYTTLTRYNPDGSRDHTFATDGRTVFPQGKVPNGIYMAIQPDGMILFATEDSRGASSLMRCTPNGKLDMSFGHKGVAAAGPDHIDGIAFSRKRIFITRYTTGFQVERYTMTGQLDTAFAGGIIKTNLAPDAQCYCQSVVAQKDGKVIVAGNAHDSFALVRNTWDGKLDSTFNSTGQVTTDFTPYSQAISRIFLQPDGKILAVGRHDGGEGYTYCFARYLPNGQLDPGYGAAGKVITRVGGNQYMALQRDGKLVIAGGESTSYGASKDIVVPRYNADGSIDTSFGKKGSTRTDFNGTIQEYPRGVFALKNGKIKVLVRSVTPKKGYLVVARYLGT